MWSYRCTTTVANIAPLFAAAVYEPENPTDNNPVLYNNNGQLTPSSLDCLSAHKPLSLDNIGRVAVCFYLC